LDSAICLLQSTDAIQRLQLNHIRKPPSEHIRAPMRTQAIRSERHASAIRAICGHIRAHPNQRRPQLGFASLFPSFQSFAVSSSALCINFDRCSQTSGSSTCSSIFSFFRSAYSAWSAVKNPANQKRHETEPKSNRLRTAVPNQRSKVNQKRIKPEPKPNQNRHDSEPSVQKPAQPIASTSTHSAQKSAALNYSHLSANSAPSVFSVLITNSSERPSPPQTFHFARSWEDQRMQVRIGSKRKAFRTVRFDADRNEIVLIEQRLLPHKFELVRCKDYKETARAITDMVVRGAGAIGATAAYGFAQGLRAFRGKGLDQFEAQVERVYRTLAEARPTAVDPVNAMNTIRDLLNGGKTIAEKQTIALQAAEEFADEDVEHCQAIGQHGAKLIKDGMRVLTHCNAGWLAFVDIGSATAPIYAARDAGRKFHVYCSETRPRCQGASLTAWELAQEGISHQVVSDNAAGHLMQRGMVDLVIVGSDRTLGRTGEVANKIGTYTRAAVAARHKIPFYVAIPLSTIDWSLKSGMEIPIEDRHESEVLGAWGVTANGKREYVRIANPSSGAVNPGFDVTPAELITGIITPEGIFRPKDLWKNRAKLGGG
jgi:methylthioribose-1-phosphate isomerase